MPPNVFSALARYADRAEENYLTESLVFVARLLLARQPEIGLDLVNLLACQSDQPWFTSADSVEITTQVTTTAGTPDIELRQDDTVVYIEVKHDSPLSSNQLERYKAQLSASGCKHTRLVLLTRSRYTAVDTTLSADEYNRLYWYNVHNWLLKMNSDDEVCCYFVTGLAAFLEEKRMSMKHIDDAFVAGILAMLDLTEMMETAIAEALPGIHTIHTAGWHWRGFYLPGDYWFGFRFHQPTVLLVEDNRGYDPVTYRKELDLLSQDFFSMGKDEQFECLVAFLREATAGIAELDPALDGD